MIFAIPRGKVTYVGTTDTNFDKDKDDVRTDLADAIYLISAVNNMFPKINLEMKDIISSWAGLRPLIHEEGKSASELSRKDEIFTSDTGLISMAGGKLTGYRKMAERVVNLIEKNLEEEEGFPFVDCTTADIPLCGNEFKEFKHVKRYIEEVFTKIKEDGFERYDAWYLVTTYGKQTEKILEYYSELNDQDIFIRMAKAELHFSIQYEMTITPIDFFVRRTGRLYFDIDSIAHLQEAILNEFKTIFNLGSNQIKEYKNELELMVKDHSDFSIERF